jgi:hypothetical protein
LTPLDPLSPPLVTMMVYCKKSMHNSLVARYFDKLYMP